jgi:hypothetical protein
VKKVCLLFLMVVCCKSPKLGASWLHRWTSGSAISCHSGLPIPADIYCVRAKGASHVDTASS